MIDTIDFTTTATGRLIQQYKEAVKFNQLVELYAGLGQEVDDAIQDLLNLRDVATAVGVQLDVIGRIVGQTRTLISTSTLEHFGVFNVGLTLPAFAAGFGDLTDPAEGARFISVDEVIDSSTELADPEYRLFITAKILKNKFRGTANEMIAVAVLLGETENVELTEGVKTVTINFNAVVDVNRYALIQSNELIPKPAGVILTITNVIT